MPKYALELDGDPSAEGFPSTFAAFLSKIREYTQVSTDSDDPDGDTVRSILVQTTQPSSPNDNDLWVKIHSSTSRPIGLYSYTGSAWKVMNQSNSGITADRPTDGTVGELYYDTTIQVMLMWNGSAWVTQSGSPGDIKFVYAADEATALANNPGWSRYTDADGRCVVAVDPDDTEVIDSVQKYKTAGNTFGSKTHTLVEAELPSHSHGGISTIDPTHGDGGTGSDAITYPVTSGGSQVDFNTGSDTAHENRPPVITAYCLKKD